MWELDHKEGWTPKNWCFWTVVLKKTLESPLDCKEIKTVNPKGNQPWIFIGRTDDEAEVPIISTWYKELPQKRPWCWERLKAGGEGDDREWDGWMASLTQWTWVWASFSRWWRTGKPGMLQSMGSPRVRHDWVTEQHQIIHWSTKYWKRVWSWGWCLGRWEDHNFLNLPLSCLRDIQEGRWV